MRGGKHCFAKLADEDIPLIRQLLAERERLLKEARKLTNEKIGAMFEVHKSTIAGVANFSNWSHL